MSDAPRPFNGAEVARHIAAGHVIKLGGHLTLWLDGGDYVQRCERCDAEQRVPFTPTRIALVMEQGIAFIMRHQHKERAS